MSARSFLLFALVACFALLSVTAAPTSCTKEFTKCLKACPAKCGAEHSCLAQCFQACTTSERKCLSAAEVVVPVEEAPAAAPAAAPSADSSSLLSEEEYQSHFSFFVKSHSKKYAHDEFFPRYSIFKANLNAIRAHNAMQQSYTLAVNEFADMTLEEFQAKYTGFKPIDMGHLRAKNGPKAVLGRPANADSLDWRTKGAVTPVKNQQSCGSCWAFSAVGAIEGAVAVKSGQLLDLSEQQLVDCSWAQGNEGCNGGLMNAAMQWVVSEGGITSQQNYPYTARDGQCQSGKPVAATISSFVDITEGDEDALMDAANLGPVSVAVAASAFPFQFYSGGVLDNAACGRNLDHGVTLVGYGTESGKDFWIIKNSWGSGWGESGYIRFVRGKNQCGVADFATYAIA